MSALTVLLVPPAGDTALLADECGGRVPMWWATPDHLHEPHWTQPDEDDGDDFVSAEVCVECGEAWPCALAGQVAVPSKWRPPYANSSPAIPAGRPRALLLVHEGASVAMGCDRLARSMNVLPYGAYTEAWAHTMGRAYAGEHPGARVVLLRDRREVPS